MAITEESRQDLFQLFETTYGREGALLIMDFLLRSAGPTSPPSTTWTPRPR
ncbi:MAG: hypothetical protein R2746_12285 [Acidimicrobiales bacterium]